MTAPAWPHDLADAFSAYAAALAALPGGAETAARFRGDLLAPQSAAWGLAQPLSAWGRYRPQALLARSLRSRDAAGMFGRLKRSWTKADAEHLPPVDFDNLFPWDDLAGPASKVEAAIRKLPPETVSAARLGETLEAWPPAPSLLPTKWPSLRDALLTALPPHFTGPPLVAFLHRLLTAEKRTAEDVIAAGPSLTAQWAYRALVADRPKLLPELDPTTLKPTAIPANTHDEYRESSEPLGTVLRVQRFAVPPEAPVLLRSAGLQLRHDLALAAAPLDDAPLPQGPMRDRVVGARLSCIQRLLAGEIETIAVDLSDDDRAWIAALGDHPHFDAWYQPILRWSGLKLLPAATATGFTWPEDVSLAQPGVTATVDCAPLGTILGVERTALRPQDTKFTMSVGPTAGAATTAAELWAQFAEQPRAEAAAALVDAVWRGRTPTPQELLQACDAVQASELPNHAAAMELLRILISQFGHTLLPTDAEPTFDRDASEERTGVRGVPVFRLNDPLGVVFRIRAYGLRTGERIVRPAEVSVSVGVPPPNLTEMERLLPRCPADVVTPLKDGCAGLRRAALNGYLEQALIDLFQRFWNAVHKAWLGVDPEGVNSFDGYLRQSLEQRFGLRTFEPRSVLEHPDGWAALPPGSRITSGLVRKILAPGLLDASGGLRLPALVEAD